MAREGINAGFALPNGRLAVRFARRAVISVVFNTIFAVGLAFFWFILRSYGPTGQNELGDYAVWLLASVAHAWYYSSERWVFKVLVACVSLAVNAAVLTSIERMCIG